METPFIIYLRAFGIYALLTIVTLFLPVLYFMSIYYVLIYGWFACGLFILTSILLDLFDLKPITKYYILASIIPVAVAFAFQMIETFGGWENVWQSGTFLLFPLAAIVSGWISLYINFKNDRKKETMMAFEFSNKNE